MNDEFIREREALLKRTGDADLDAIRFNLTLTPNERYRKMLEALRSILCPDGTTGLDRIAEVLQRWQVRVVVVWDIATHFHGGEAIRQGVALLYDSSAENLARLSSALREIDAFPFNWKQEIVFVVDHVVAEIESLYLHSQAGSIYLVKASPDRFDEVWRKSEELKLSAATMRVAGQNHAEETTYERETR